MIAESIEAMSLLTESELAAYIRSVIRDLEQNPTENHKRGMRVMANLPGRPRNPEEEDLYDALWVAVFASAGTPA
jgi:hypothetical protein